MYRKVLIPLDGSEASEATLTHAASLVGWAEPEELILLRVVDDERDVQAATEYLDVRAARLLSSWRERDLSEPRVPRVVLTGPRRNVPSILIDFAEDSAVDLIMMTSHGESDIQRWFLGSVTEKVLRGSDIPVFLIPAARTEGESDQARQVLVPLDGSEVAERALPIAGRIARATGARMTLLHVDSTPTVGQRNAETGVVGRPRTSAREDVREYLEAQGSGTFAEGVATEARIRHGQPAEEILADVEEHGVDMVVMTTHGRTGLDRWAFGSVADRLLRASPVPVLLIRARAVPALAPSERAQGIFAHRCYNCGRRTHRVEPDREDRCLRCDYLLRSCHNCFHWTGQGCMIGMPYTADLYPGNRCPRFQFRQTPLPLA